MLQKAYAEGLRALYLYTATFQDRIRIAEAAGDRRRSSPSGSTTCCCRSSRASAPSGPPSSSSQSLQTLGGSGYLQDYPIEQYIRDSKIDSLYEGTTAIQSLDFLFRKIVRDNGAALGVVAGRDPGVHRRARRATAGSRRSGRCWLPRWPTSRACSPRSPAT